MKHLNEKTLNALADGMLSEREQQVAEAHLATCSNCRRRMTEISMLWDFLAALPPSSGQEKLKHRTLAALKKERRSESPSRRWFGRSFLQNPIVYATATAGIVLGLFLGTMAKTVIVEDRDPGNAYILSNSNETTDISEPYLTLILNDNGGEL